MERVQECSLGKNQIRGDVLSKSTKYRGDTKKYRLIHLTPPFLRDQESPSSVMGVGASHQTKLEREFGGIGDGDGQERYFGLENFGNTCYCNSVLQARKTSLSLGRSEDRFCSVV